WRGNRRVPSGTETPSMRPTDVRVNPPEGMVVVPAGIEVHLGLLLERLTVALRTGRARCGSPDPAVGPTAGLPHTCAPLGETFGQPGGQVRRPRHSALRRAQRK